jgi:hypothetical protein
MITEGSLQSWLLVLAPYFAILLPTIIGYLNNRKLSQVQATADRVEVNGNGHTSALIEMARSVDPAIAAVARAVVVEAAKDDAAAVLRTAHERELRSSQRPEGDAPG